ncbi:hypothetical protein M885DRAFT_613555 [Pelagophyceae sp. CCMP2097]|nr:hypothetical protein M885DRAFT_613555 [Pelagophyceae sp. CCMP2097]
MTAQQKRRASEGLENVEVSPQRSKPTPSDDDALADAKAAAAAEGLVLDIEAMLLDDCMLDVVFDLLRAVKAGSAQALRALAEGDECDDAPRDRPPSPTGKKPASGGARPPTPDFKVDFNCAHCGQKVNASRFAPHLDKCMGKGRGSRRSGLNRSSG